MRMKAARCTYPLSDGFTVSFDSATIKRVNFQWSNAAYNPASMSCLESLFAFHLPVAFRTMRAWFPILRRYTAARFIYGH